MTYPFCNLVDLHKLEVAVWVEVLVAQQALPDDLVGHLALDVHEELQHVVVGLPGEHDLTRR